MLTQPSGSVSESQHNSFVDDQTAVTENTMRSYIVWFSSGSLRDKWLFQRLHTEIYSVLNTVLLGEEGLRWPPWLGWVTQWELRLMYLSKPCFLIAEPSWVSLCCVRMRAGLWFKKLLHYHFILNRARLMWVFLFCFFFCLWDLPQCTMAHRQVSWILKRRKSHFNAPLFLCSQKFRHSPVMPSSFCSLFF